MKGCVGGEERELRIGNSVGNVSDHDGSLTVESSGATRRMAVSHAPFCRTR
jgi:hypothetical protein